MFATKQRTVTAIVHAIAVALVGAAGATAASAEEYGGGPIATNGQLTRDEVIADFNLYRRAGLAEQHASEAFNPLSADSRRKLDAYQQQRSGAAFQRELARVQGGGNPALADADLGAGVRSH